MLDLLEYLVFFIIGFIGIFYILFYVFKREKAKVELTSKLFVISILITIPTIFFEKIVLSYGRFPEMINSLYQAFVIGFIEEFIKRYILISFTYKSHKQGRYLGLGYAIIIASGFATGENICYFFGYRSYDLELLRVTLSSSGHLCFAIILGILITIARHARRGFTKQYYFVMSLVVPIILHSIFDYIILLNIYRLLPVYLVFVVIIYLVFFKKYKLYITYLMI